MCEVTTGIAYGTAADLVLQFAFSYLILLL